MIKEVSGKPKKEKRENPQQYLFSKLIILKMQY